MARATRLSEEREVFKFKFKFDTVTEQFSWAKRSYICIFITVGPIKKL